MNWSPVSNFGSWECIRLLRQGAVFAENVRELKRSTIPLFFYQLKIDFCKMFDALNHSILLAKLLSFGIDDNTVSLLHNYIVESK